VQQFTTAEGNIQLLLRMAAVTKETFHGIEQVKMAAIHALPCLVSCTSAASFAAAFPTTMTAEAEAACRLSEQYNRTEHKARLTDDEIRDCNAVVTAFVT
jgi:hypothetical protein